MKFLLKSESKWLRVAIFGVLFMLVPTILHSGWDSYWKYYYETTDITKFYEAVSLEAESVCVGDLKQTLKSVRFVKQTDTGWSVDIVRELSVIDDGLRVKIFDEAATVFVEKKEDGVNTRQTALPLLDAGLYQWEITIIRLYLPYNVVRIDTPSLVSNLFAIDDCNNK